MNTITLSSTGQHWTVTPGFADDTSGHNSTSGSWKVGWKILELLALASDCVGLYMDMRLILTRVQLLHQFRS